MKSEKTLPVFSSRELVVLKLSDMHLEVPDQELGKQRTPGVTVKGCFLLTQDGPKANV